MKGSSISVRIADFLKEYPPFQFLDRETLRELASQAKVKFHEDQEIVFSQGQPRDQWIYVIQQGNVRILDESGDKEALVDLRGPGDLLGLHGIRSEEPYQHTCKTDTETILYGLPRKLFVSLAERSTEARRYIAAYFSLNPAYHWNGMLQQDDSLPGESGPVTLRRGGLWEVDPPHRSARDILVTVNPDTPIREIARQLQSRRIDCVVVVDEAGLPIGKLADAHLRDRLVEGPIDPDAPVRNFMLTQLEPVSPRDNTGDLLIKLTQLGQNFLVVTEDGTLNSPPVGLVSERNLFLQYGRFPTVIGDAITSAPDIAALRSLRDRLEALILEFLDGRRALNWLMRMVGVLNRKLTNRVVELAVESLREDGQGEPLGRFSWLMMGSGGRDELLIRSAVYHALVYDDPAASLQTEAARYFEQLAQRVALGIRQCGFLESPQNVLAHQGWCLPLSAMCDRFSNYIRHPVEAHVYSARDAFDFRPVTESECSLAAMLSRHVDAELASHPEFIRHMASDSLLNQPPRTIFSGYVVDQQGIRQDQLAIKSHALLPLVDVARVLTLESGSHRPCSTLHRLQQAGLREPAGSRLGDLLKEATEGLLVAQYARISQGLRTGTDGAVIHPGSLDPETRTLLITTFRTILGILEATSERFDLNWRE